MNFQLNFKPGFKFKRAALLILVIWSVFFLTITVYMRIERFNCCALEADGYRLDSFFRYLFELSNSAKADCSCDLRNLPVTYYIIPIEAILGALSGVIGLWLIYRSKTNDEGCVVK